MANPHSTLTRRDDTFVNTAYLPAAAASNYSTAMDLENVAGAPVYKFGMEVVVAAAPNNTDNTKTITLTLYDSANGSSYAEVAPRIQCRIVGVASTGSVATTFRFLPPPGLRRYVKSFQEVAAGGGDNTGVLVTYALTF